MLLVCIGSASTVLVLLALFCLQANGTCLQKRLEISVSSKDESCVATWHVSFLGAFSLLPSTGGSCVFLVTVHNSKHRLKSGNSKNEGVAKQNIAFAPNGRVCRALREQARAELEHGSFSDV